jgi:hypothetical protein
VTRDRRNAAKAANGEDRNRSSGLVVLPFSAGCRPRSFYRHNACLGNATAAAAMTRLRTLDGSCRPATLKAPSGRGEIMSAALVREDPRSISPFQSARSRQPIDIC